MGGGGETGDGRPADGDTTGDEPSIPRPPSPEALDVISGAQGLITDEWAPQPAPEASGAGGAEQVPEPDDRPTA